MRRRWARREQDAQTQSIKHTDAHAPELRTVSKIKSNQRCKQARSGPSGWGIERDLLDGTRLCHSSASTSCQLCLCRDRVEGGKRRGGGSVQGDSLYIKGQEGGKKEHVNLLDKEEGFGGGGAGWKLKQSLFLLGRCFCACMLVKERGGGMLCAGWMTQADLIALTK